MNVSRRQFLAWMVFFSFLAGAAAANVTAITRPAIYVSTNSAILAGTVTSDTPTNAVVYFEWGATTSYGNRTQNQPVSGITNASVEVGLASLNPGATYHCRLVASNASGISLGSDKVVRTSGTAASWPQIYNGPDALDDTALAMVTDGAGDIYVLGHSEDSSASYGFLLIKYSSAGAELWRARYDSSGDGRDLPIALALDSQTNIIMTGAIAVAPWNLGSDFLTMKYSSSGQLLWARTYRGVSGGLNWAVGVGIDGADNIYVAGASEGGQALAYRDFVVLKYAANGTVLWTNRYQLANTNSDPCCLAVESNGNVTISGEIANAGGTIRKWATLKYNALGNQLWARIFDGGINGVHSPAAMTVDAAGNVYVAGKHQAIDGTGNNFATVKYDIAGNVLWTAFFNGGANSDDGATAIALDGMGNILVGGYSGNVVKYSSSGQQLWSASYVPVASLKADSFGNIVVAGSALASDFPVWKLDANGTRIWSTNEIPGPGILSIQVRAFSLTTGNVVYATGYRRAVAAGNPNDYFTTRYVATTNAGAPAILTSPIGTNAIAGATLSLSVNAAGTPPLTFQWRLNGTIVAGATNASLLFTNVRAVHAGDYSVEVSNAWGRVTSTGARLWVLEITNQPVSQGSLVGATALFAARAGGAPLAYHWRFNGLAIPGATDPVLTLSNVQPSQAGNYDVVVTNWFGALTSQVAVLVVYSHARQEWAAETNAHVSPSLVSLLRPVVTDSIGNAYIAGLEVARRAFEVMKYSPSGLQLWRDAFPGSQPTSSSYATALALDSQENVVVTGVFAKPPDFVPPFGPGVYWYTTYKYSPNGILLFASSIEAPPPGPGEFYPAPPTMALDADNNSFVAGKALVAKLATNGQTLWISNHLFLNSPAISVGPLGNVFIAGTSTNALSDYVTVKRAGTGAILWTRLYDAAAGADRVASVAGDAAGNVFVSGTSASGVNHDDIVTLKYASDGTLLWTARFDGAAHGHDEAVAVQADAFGNVFVGGNTIGTNGTQDFVLVKYFGSNGAPAWVRYFDGSSQANDTLAAMSLDVLGNVCIAGASIGNLQRGFKTLQFDADGYKLWESFFPVPGDQIGVTGLAANNGRAVYLVGVYRLPPHVRPIIKYGIDATPTGGRFTSYRPLGMNSAEYSILTIAGHTYTLESTTNPLPTANWFAVSNVTSMSGEAQISVSTTNNAQFYRLRLAP